MTCDRLFFEKIKIRILEKMIAPPKIKRSQLYIGMPCELVIAKSSSK